MAGKIPLTMDIRTISISCVFEEGQAYINSDGRQHIYHDTHLALALRIVQISVGKTYCCMIKKEKDLKLITLEVLQMIWKGHL